MRRISELTIAGYRSVSVEQPCRLSFGDVALLIGPNGSGKSNIVSVFKMIQSGLGAKTIEMLEKGGAQSQFHLGPKHTERASFSVSVRGPQDSPCCLDWSIGFASPNSITMSWKSSESDEIGFDAFVRVYQFNDTSLFSGMRLPSYSGNDGILMSDARNLAPYLRRMRSEFPEYYSRLVRYVRLAVPGFADFRLSDDSETHDVMLDWTGADATGYVFGPHQLSDGSLRFICLAALLLAPPEMSSEVIVIDEPELGLHPAAIGGLAAMINHAAEHSQVVVATQSPILVDEFPVSDIRIVDRSGADGHTTCVALDESSLHEWLEEYSTSELWLKNVIGGNP